MQHLVYELPPLRKVVRQAGPHLLEGTIIPVALFYGALHVLGVTAALVAALVWSYGAVAWRLVSRRPLPGLLLLGVATLTARTAIAVASGSVFLYFLQPTLGTVLVAALFLVSVPAGRPLAARLAEDFCPLPPSMTDHHGIRRFFARITVLWAFVMLLNAGASLWMLTHQSVSTYLVTRPAVSLGLTAVAIGASTLWFKRSLSHHGIRLAWATARVER
jgi:hypothetical protein